jgi:hypothetical protein
MLGGVPSRRSAEGLSFVELGSRKVLDVSFEHYLGRRTLGSHRRSHAIQAQARKQHCIRAPVSWELEKVPPPTG